MKQRKKLENFYILQRGKQIFKKLNVRSFALYSTNVLAVAFLFVVIASSPPELPEQTYTVSDNQEFLFLSNFNGANAYFGLKDEDKSIVNVELDDGSFIRYGIAEYVYEDYVKEGSDYLKYRISDDMDVEYVLENDRIKENIILYNQPTNGNQILFEFESKGFVPRIEANTERIYFSNYDTGDVFYLDEVYATDGDGREFSREYFEFQVYPTTKRAILTIDETVLAAARYPLKIDPTLVYIDDTQTEFSTGAFRNTSDIGSGDSDPVIQLYQQEMAIDPNTVALIHFEESGGYNGTSDEVVDSSGWDNHGTASGDATTASTTPFVGDYYATFDGSGDYIDITNHASLNPTDVVSFDFWMYPTADSGSGATLLAKNASSSSGYWALFSENTCDSGGVRRLTFYLGTGSDTALCSDSQIPLNEWTHVAMVYDGSYKRIYIDGVLDGEQVKTGAISTTTNPLRLGEQSDSSGTAYTGYIDEVRVSDAVRLPDEILAAASYRPTGEFRSEVIDLGIDPSTWNPLTWTETKVNTGDGETPFDGTNLVAQWNFNETSGTTANNDAEATSCGGTPANCDLTLTSMTTTGQDDDIASGWTNNNRLWGNGGLAFDGSNDYATTTDDNSLDFTGDFTMTAWVNVTDLSTERVIFDKGAGSMDRYSLILQTDGGLLANIDSGNATDKSPDKVKLNEWSYVAATYDSATKTWSHYINGEFSNSYVDAEGDFGGNSANFSIGRWSYVSANYFEGVIDSPKVYDDILTADEIKANYQVGNIEFLTRSSANSNPNDVNAEYVEDSNNLVAHWVYNETSGTTSTNIAGDSSCGGTPTNCDGTLTNFASTGSQDADANSGWTATGRRWGNGALRFDGSNDYMNIGDVNEFDFGSTDSFTTSLWFNTTATAGANAAVMLTKLRQSGTTYPLYVALTPTTNLPIFTIWDGASNPSAIGPVALNDGIWHHFVGVRDVASDLLLIYIDGVLVDTSTDTTTGSLGNTYNAVLGCILNSVQTACVPAGEFDGELDDVRVYNRALNSNEIRDLYLDSNGWENWKCSYDEEPLLTFDGSLYSTGSKDLISYWGLNETEDNSCGDGIDDVCDLVYGNEGEDTGGSVIVDGVFGKARNFDGTDDRIRIPNTGGPYDFGSTDDFSYGAWFRTDSTSTLRTLMAKEDGSRPTWHFLLLTGGTMQMGFQPTDTGTYTKSTANTVNDGEWHFIAATVDMVADQAELYLDGKSEGTLALPDGKSYGEGSTDLLLGARIPAAPDRFWQGDIDESFVYGRELQADEIYDMWLAGANALRGPEGLSHTLDTSLSYQNSDLANITPYDVDTVAYWKLDETNGDLVGDDLFDETTNANNGEFAGTDIADGIIDGVSNTAREFNGTDDTIVIGNESNFDLTDYVSISAWVYINASGGLYDAIISKGNGSSTGGGFEILYEGYTAGQIDVEFFGGSGVYVVKSADISVGEWHHLLGTFDKDQAGNNKVKLYLDGVETGTYTTGGSMTTIATNDFDLRLGIDSDGSNYFNGKLDEVAVWDRVLTADEAASIYRRGAESLNNEIDEEGSRLIQTGMLKVDSDTIGYWTLDDTNGDLTGDDIFDSTVYTNHGEINGTNLASGVVQGISGKSRDFNGTDDWINISNVNGEWSDGSNPSSVEAWVNATLSSSTSEKKSIVNHQGRFELAYDPNESSGSFVLRLYDTSSASATYTTTTQEGDWHYIVGTFDPVADEVKLYVDGVLRDTQTQDGWTKYSSSIDIGSQGAGNDQHWPGKIDEVRISSVVRTADEIRAMYQLGSNTYTTYTLSDVDLSSSSLLTLAVTADRPGTYLEITIGEDEYSNNEVGANTLGLWHLEEMGTDESVTDLIIDSSGNQNHGQLGGGTSGFDPLFVEGRIGMSRDFDGTDDYIDLHDVDTGSTFTASLWAKADSTTGQFPMLGKKASSYSQSSGFFLQWDALNDEFTVRGSNGTAGTTLPVLRDTEWHHFAAVYNGATVTLYIDGRDYTDASSVASVVDNNDDLEIGRSFGTEFNGRIDEVRIDDEILTAEQIRSIYERSKRSYQVTIDFVANLVSGAVIDGPADTAFSVDATGFGASTNGGSLHVGDRIIVREFYDGVQYTAESVVDTITLSTGAITVKGWDSKSTFPSGGFTEYATVQKWQQEYLDLRQALDTTLDDISKLTVRVVNGNEGRNIWIDDVYQAAPFLSNPAGSTMLSETSQYVQYKGLFSTYGTQITPALEMVTIEYVYGPTLDEIMRHGQWFDGGLRQVFFWAD